LRDEEFVKRTGFSLMVTLAVHDKKASDEVFEQFLPVISRGRRIPEIMSERWLTGLSGRSESGAKA